MYTARMVLKKMIYLNCIKAEMLFIFDFDINHIFKIHKIIITFNESKIFITILVNSVF